MQIRPYTPADLDTVAGLVALNTPAYFAPEEEEDFRLYLKNEAEDYFVVEIKGEIVGSGGINYFPEEKLVRLSWDVIHPDFQGKGIGKNLTMHRLNYILTQTPYKKVIVRTSQVVFPFYEKMGFHLEKVIPDYWAKGFDLYYMCYDFNPVNILI
ncbi:MAG: GNAT family N-acetyltransferase [Bacteroidia bacterium]